MSLTGSSVLPPSFENLSLSDPQPQSLRPFPHSHFANLTRNATSQPVKFPPNMVLQRTLNQVILVGRVVEDPIKKGTTEHPMAEFFIATHSSYKTEEGEQVQKTDWHRICVFKPCLRDLVFTHLKKGQSAHITGKIVYSTTIDNVSQNRVSIFADRIVFFPGLLEDVHYNN